MTKDELKRVLESEVFNSGNTTDYPGARYLLKQIKETILLNIDKEGVDLVDLVNWAISDIFTTSIKAAVASFTLPESTKPKLLTLDWDLPS